jgi:hypothetical protein
MITKEQIAYAAIALAGGFIGGVSTRLLPPRARFETITAQKVVLVDKNGNGRAQMGAADNGLLALDLYDQNRRPRAWLGVQPDGSPMFGFSDASGASRLALTSDALVFGNSKGKQRAALVVTDRTSVFGLSDNDGAQRARLEAKVGGMSGFGLFDIKGRDRLSLELPANGDGLIYLDEQDGKYRAQIATAGDRIGFLFGDPNGNHRAVFGISNGRPSLAFFDPKGKTIKKLP